MNKENIIQINISERDLVCYIFSAIVFYIIFMV